MKKYLYILLSLLTLSVVGCEEFNMQAKPDVAFYFGQVTSTTTDSTARVELSAYMTVDEVFYPDAIVYIEYWKSGEAENVTTLREYEAGDTVRKQIFTVTDLEASTMYLARVVIDGGAEYGSQSEMFTFTTKRRESITCDVNVVAKGIKATVNLTNVAYLLNDEAQQIASVMVEYARKGTEEWCVAETSGNNLKNGKATISIPKSGDSYLAENSDYTLRVTITPSNNKLLARSTEDYAFKTTYAEITAKVATPGLSYNGEGITISMGDVSVYYDGVMSQDYTSHIYFRTQGDNLWTECALTDGKSVLIPIEQLQDNTTYEAMTSIVAGAKGEVRESAVATITTPKPEVPILPEPPVGGVTPSIEGVWHLSSWRGATPSFDVYMDITATGGITLYQRIESIYWDVYQSTATISNGVISGVYTDKVAWGASYNLVVEGDTMTWTSTADSTDVSVYTRSSLPASMPTAPTRAVVPSERFL